MANQTGVLACTAALTSTTADTAHLTTAVMEVRVQNTHATANMWVKYELYDAATIFAGTAVAAEDDEAIFVPATQEVVIWRGGSGRRRFVAVSVVSTATAKFVLRGSIIPLNR